MQGFAAAKGQVLVPVNGKKIGNYGATGRDSAAKGVLLAAAAGAQVRAPHDSCVIYAGPYRTYGQVLILNTSEGYHVVIAGMEHISVNVGQCVRKGEPVGT